MGWAILGIVLITAWVGLTRNRRVQQRKRLREAWSEMDGQLEHRHGLVPNQEAIPKPRCSVLHQAHPDPPATLSCPQCCAQRCRRGVALRAGGSPYHFSTCGLPVEGRGPFPATRRWRAWLLCAALGAAATSRAEERILSYHSDITVAPDSTMTVRETIRVRAENDAIQRGIYRDFPLRYRDRAGNRIVVGFELIETRRDLQLEPHHTEPLSNGIRIKIGNPDVILEPGEYTYTLVYRTHRQLGFFDDHDELYWNVTGNDWAFPIDKASALVRLPASMPPGQIGMEGYTGVEGSTQQAGGARLDEGAARFEATRRLQVGEGLTLVATWPKGHVAEPSRDQQLRWFLQDNRSAGVALAGLAILLVYYIVVWFLVGKDPAKGAITPRYHPPEKIAPAAARFIWRMGYDDRCFAAALIHLGVQGCVRLSRDAKGYTLTRLVAKPENLAPEEKKLLRTLLGSRTTISLQQKNHSTLSKAKETLRDALATAHEKHHFARNTRYWLPGIIVVLGSVAGAAILGRIPPMAGFVAVWLLGWTVGVVLLLGATAAAWRRAWKSGGSAIAAAAFLTLFSIPFLIGEAVGIGMFAVATSPLTVAAVGTMVVVLIVFFRLMKAPTLIGRRVLDELEGFQLYLSATEQDRLALMQSPRQTPELFEAFLPYALALDVEQEWAEQFAYVVTEANQGETSPYQPAWYDDPTHGPLAPGAFAGAIGGALASAVSSSSTAPGSSSGSGGGGSSGGGGGGGGGGGW